MTVSSACQACRQGCQIGQVGGRQASKQFHFANLDAMIPELRTRLDEVKFSNAEDAVDSTPGK